jgi:hypothetical protein
MDRSLGFRGPIRLRSQNLIQCSLRRLPLGSWPAMAGPGRFVTAVVARPKVPLKQVEQRHLRASPRLPAPGRLPPNSFPFRSYSRVRRAKRDDFDVGNTVADCDTILSSTTEPAHNACRSGMFDPPCTNLTPCPARRLGRLGHKDRRSQTIPCLVHFERGVGNTTVAACWRSIACSYGCFAERLPATIAVDPWIQTDVRHCHLKRRHWLPGSTVMVNRTSYGFGAFPSSPLSVVSLVPCHGVSGPP